MNKHAPEFAFAMVVCGLIIGCSPTPGGTMDDIVDDQWSGPPGTAVDGLSDEDAARFESGREIFELGWASPAGLGPLFTATSCAECHGDASGGATGGVHRFRVASTEAGGFGTIIDRNTPPVYGVGLIELVDDEEILSRQDPFDADGDGISGRPNIDEDRVGRFGRKAQAATLQSIIRGMLVNQSGITSEEADETRAVMQANQPSGPSTVSVDTDSISDPEITEEDLLSLLSFAKNLSAPQRNVINGATRRGEEVFTSSGCTACHTASLELESGGQIYPYSDLLLHDMGPRLADGILVGAADSSEFRTQPLWGLSGAAPYLHDGRAETIQDAIDAHGGEASSAQEAYEGLSDEDRADILSFLTSL